MCTNPHILVKYGMNPETNKPYTKIKNRIDFSLADYYKLYGRDNVFLVPCGHCAECILKKRKEWAFRCSLEALYHYESSFLTLTYADEFLPGSLDEVKEDLKKFIKSVRNSGFKVRYFGCGERGEQFGRLHAHIILFGFLPSDLVYDSKSDSGEALFTSNFVDNLWKKGRCTVQLVGENVGQYVAGYTSKKLGLKNGFQIQSTKPGIGYQFFIDNKDLILKYDRVYSSSGSGKVPRYFEKLFSDLIESVKAERVSVASKIGYSVARNHNIQHIEEMSFMNANHYNNILLRLERCL